MPVPCYSLCKYLLSQRKAPFFRAGLFYHLSQTFFQLRIGQQQTFVSASLRQPYGGWIVLSVFLPPVALSHGTLKRLEHGRRQFRGVFIKLNIPFCRRLHFLQLFFRGCLAIFNGKGFGYNKASFPALLPYDSAGGLYSINSPILTSRYQHNLHIK